MSERWVARLRLALLLLLPLSACARETPSPAAPTSTLTAPTAPPSTAAPTPTSTPTPRVRRLVLCSTEPLTASPFDPSRAGNDLLALFYEEPAEQVAYRWEARLLERLPSLENGDAFTRTVAVPPGTSYVDENGALQVNDGDAPLELPQLVVTFALQNGLQWSDGEPLTSEDVLLGYHLAQEPQARGRWRDLVERTARFESLNERTLRWTGVPGYLSTSFPGFCFPPQPAHSYQGKRLAEILQERTPPGTGPFVIESWEAGIEARLHPNPHYSGPTPLLEEIVVRFPQFNPAQWPSLLASGECDVILPDPATKISWQQWVALMAQGDALIWADTGPQPTFQRLDFNLAPADGRVTPLADRKVRAALAACIDRGELAMAQPGQAFLPADTFLPPDHPAFAGGTLTRIPYNPAHGQALLEGAGWRDMDGDGIREAHDVEDFPDGAPLSLTLTLAPQYTISAAHIAANLETCGVGVLPQPTDARLLYAADPASPLFGRTFDLVLFGWWAEAPQVCGAWRSDRIPGEGNTWIGENFSGYVSEAYDAACQRALTAVDAGAQHAALHEAEELLAQDLPTLFLTWRPYWFVARPEVQGLQPDASNPAALWNSEEFSVGE